MPVFNIILFKQARVGDSRLCGSHCSAVMLYRNVYVQKAFQGTDRNKPKSSASNTTYSVCLNQGSTNVFKLAMGLYTFGMFSIEIT